MFFAFSLILLLTLLLKFITFLPNYGRGHLHEVATKCE